jgi:3-deoxy-manno-octulosonate cytidylyltransferase (CMP-KDO synthetase)
MTSTALAVIPARLAASRLPGKPLLEMAGRSIVQWVWDAAVAADVFDEVVVATPDAAIADAVVAFGGHVRMTSHSHPTGTDRVAEVASGSEHEIVANIQGDQPFVTEEMLRELVEPFRSAPKPKMTTIATRVTDPALVSDPNTVKVVLDRIGDALYFSRAAIPHAHAGGAATVLHHLGLYAFERDFLARFAGLEPGPLELVEGLEQLRALENGHRIRVSEVSMPTLEINTPADLERARRLVEDES